MASEELQGSDVQSQGQAPAAVVPTSLRQYPEMILTSIKDMNEKTGSNKSAISKHIEGTFGTLPPAHSALLTHHLNKMKSAGQLHFIKNNYLIPDHNSPPRRGRGRPPKPKTLHPPVAVPLSPRPRGRPPKSRHPTATTTTPAAVSGRKRGRPPKAVTAPPPAAAPRGRGRPPKVKPPVNAAVGA